MLIMFCLRKGLGQKVGCVIIRCNVVDPHITSSNYISDKVIFSEYVFGSVMCSGLYRLRYCPRVVTK